MRQVEDILHHTLLPMEQQLSKLVGDFALMQGRLVKLEAFVAGDICKAIRKAENAVCSS